METWRLGRRPALDGLRAIAACLVVLRHSCAFFLGMDWFVGGGLGVTLFFVLSGFLITTLLLEEHDRGRIDVHRFYVRRAKRLLPAAFAVLAVVVAVRLGVGLRDGLLVTTLATLTYTTDYLHGDLVSGLGHYWSLAVEEQFYLIWPVVLLLALRRGAQRRRLGVGCLVLAFAVVAYRTVLLAHQPVDAVVYRADTMCDALLVGAACAFLFTSGRAPAWMGRLGWPSLVGLLALALLGWAPLFTGPGLSVVFLATALLSLGCIAAAMRSQTAFTRALSIRPLRYGGRISYSLYLWHVPIIVAVAHTTIPTWAKFAVAVPPSFALAALSRRFVEEPFLASRSGEGFDLHRREPGDAARVHAGHWAARGSASGPAPLVGQGSPRR